MPRCRAARSAAPRNPPYSPSRCTAIPRRSTSSCAAGSPGCAICCGGCAAILRWPTIWPSRTLLQAWHTLASLKTANAFTAWLRRLAINVWLQHLRGAAGHGWIGESAAVGTASEPAAPAAIGLQLDLDRALARLRPEMRVCVVLAYHEKLSHSEISSATGYPLGTVKSHIKRGAEQLRSLLDAYAPKESQHGR